MTGSKAEVELSTSTVDDDSLPPTADVLVPEDDGTPTSSLPHQSNSIMSPHAQEFDSAVPLVCYDCPHHPSFRKPHQYK
jgi:hypothetical protein